MIDRDKAERLISQEMANYERLRANYEGEHLAGLRREIDGIIHGLFLARDIITEMED